MGIVDTMFTQYELDLVFKAYASAGLWSSIGDSVEFLDLKYAIIDIEEPTQNKMRKDCEDFLKAHYDDVKHNLEQAGHDLWFTRNGHGVGFRDRDCWENKEALTEYAHKIKSFDLLENGDTVTGFPL